MKLLAIFSIAILLLTDCREKNNPSEADKTGMRYLALGDSYTIGESVKESERWPVLFARAMRNAGKPVRAPYIIAQTGWTTGDLLLGLQNYNPAEKYDLVSLLIGVNNQYQGRSPAEYREQFRTLLLRSIDYANGEASQVFVLSTPDWGVTPYGKGSRDEIAREIDEFNAIARAECEKEHVLFIDVTPLSRHALDDPTLIAGDNLHFSGKMYQIWVDEVMQQVKSRF
ncbi:SGNH/GDSL hydrolase family protein [Dyadobacter crusticola]|uniref:SGNH/GDSL hydrolase family protein n=1 Tax=Dyadobacter crusticola TaxID=292407 RepID=UPI0004E1E753|nr:SGNH/GDSL hydrolase family protein [Dyadobacter crusticola]